MAVVGDCCLGLFDFKMVVLFFVVVVVLFVVFTFVFWLVELGTNWMRV